MSTPELLFVYGTLHPDRAPADMKADVARLTLVDAATVLGTLYELADYPALILTPRTTNQVHGFVFELPDDPALLSRLDAYEGFLPENPTASLFLRERVQATLADDALALCWAYTYNRQVIVLLEEQGKP